MKGILFILLLFITIAGSSQFYCCTYTAPPVSYLLDTYTGSAGAYSVRKLKTGATQSIELRRSSDNTTQIIGFDGNDFDQTAALAFCGGGDGFIRTWIDQSGNGRDAIQTTNSQQPRIVSSGVIETQGGKPAAHFITGSNPVLVATHDASGVTITTFSVFTALQYTSSTPADGRFFCMDNGATPDYNYYIPIIRIGSGTTVESFVLGPNDLAPITVAQSTFSLLTNISTGSAINNYKNSSTSNTASYSLSTPASVKFMRIGNAGQSGNDGLDGWISELVYWTTDQSTNRTGIETNINTYYSIY